MLFLGRRPGQSIVLSVNEVTITVTLLQHENPEAILSVSAVSNFEKRKADLSVLARRNLGERLFLTIEDQQIEILIALFEHGGVRLGIESPRNVEIVRKELLPRKCDHEDQHAKAI